MFKSYIQDQDFLLPPSFRDFLSEDHEAVILSDLIDSLDLSLLRESYKNQFLGTTAYDPRMLLKVLIYAYSHKTFSSRSIASCLHSDIAFMYLAGLGKPDFRTINRFREEKGYLLENIFTQIVLLAKNLGMIAFWTVSLDGTKIYANASREKNETMASLEKTISGLIQSAKDIDDLEDEVFGQDDGRQIPEELKTREGRQKKLQELKEQKEKAENLKQEIISRIESSKAMKDWPKAKQKALEKARVNTTDPSARMMQMKRKDFAIGYNGQIITENQIILSSFVSWSPTDTKELIPTIEKLFHQYGMFPKDLLADSGYFSWENCSFLEQNGMEAYIPPQTERIGDTRLYKYNPTGRYLYR